MLETLTILGIIYLILLIGIIWAIIDVWRKRRYSLVEKLLWTIFLLLFSIIALIIYVLVRKK